MVQFINLGKSSTGKFSEELGKALGGGISNAINHYYAGESINKVLKNPKLKNSLLSEKLGLLEEATRPFGEMGQNILKNRLMVEQRELQEKEEAKQEKSQRSLADALFKNHPELEEKGITPELLSNIPIQQLQKMDETLSKQKVDQRKKLEDAQLENKSFEDIKNEFGDRFAKIWQAATIGGRSDLLKAAIDTRLRGDDINKLLNAIPNVEHQNEEQSLENIPQMENGQLPKDFKWPTFTKPEPGYTPKQWSEERSQWRKENGPIFEKNKDRLSATKRDELGIKSLNNINESDKLPEGLSRFLINPETGDFYSYAEILGFKNKSAQLWGKEIARFQNRAKEAFGSRVTNFDLQTYMKQFPSLLNTQDGREAIIRMMSINNQLDQIYDNSLDKVYKKYGLNNIPFEKADELAKGLVKNQTEQLREEYLKLDENNLEQVKATEIPVMINGKKAFIPEEKLQEAIEKYGAQVI